MKDDIARDVVFKIDLTNLYNIYYGNKTNQGITSQYYG